MTAKRGLTSMDYAILRHVSYAASEDTDNRDGWCRWSTQPAVWVWGWEDYRPLVVHGFLERRETHNDVLLKITPQGWDALHAR